MKRDMFSIYDKKAKAYNFPYYVENELVGVRMFETTVNDRKSMIYRNPGDYVLCKVGVFDTMSGIVVPCEPPEEIVSGLELRQGDIFDSEDEQLLEDYVVKFQEEMVTVKTSLQHLVNVVMDLKQAKPRGIFQRLFGGE